MWLGVVAAACATPVRVALPSPFPLTYGGTVIPANGAVVGLDFGDGLRGQELQRAEITAGMIGLGVADRVHASVASYGGREDADASGTVWRVKARVGDLFGPLSSVSAHVAYATMSRSDRPAQDESLSAVEVAVPAEFLLTDPADRRMFSIYAGPRVTREVYIDHLDPGQTMRHVYVGALGGAHLRYRVLHFFGEATVVHVPTSVLHQLTYGGRWTVMPSGGLLVRLGGSDHKWSPARRRADPRP